MTPTVSGFGRRRRRRAPTTQRGRVFISFDHSIKGPDTPAEQQPVSCASAGRSTSPAPPPGSSSAASYDRRLRISAEISNPHRESWCPLRNPLPRIDFPPPLQISSGSQDASSTASAPSPPALHAHCRTEPAADARASDVSRKLFPEKDRLTQAKLFEKHRSESLSKPSFAFLPCARGRTHAPLASQGGRPKGRTADTQGGQSCPTSR